MSSTQLLSYLGVIPTIARKPIHLLFKLAEACTPSTHVTLAHRNTKILRPSALPTSLLRILRAQASYTVGVLGTHFLNRKQDSRSVCIYLHLGQCFCRVLLRQFDPPLTRPTSRGAPVDGPFRRCPTPTSCSSTCKYYARWQSSRSVAYGRISAIRLIYICRDF